MTEKMPSSTRLGSRPSACSTRAYSSGLSPCDSTISRSEEHTSELQSLMRISYAVFCLKKKKNYKKKHNPQIQHTTPYLNHLTPTINIYKETRPHKLTIL